MRAKTSHICSVSTVLVLMLSSIGTAAEATWKPVVDFSDAEAAEEWVSVNDNVMGGISEGRFRITGDKTLEFWGRISLENRGGFASIRTKPADLGLEGYDRIALRVRGDGRTYYLDLRTSARAAAASYRAAVRTKKDAWQEIRIPLKNFEYAVFGRRVQGVRPLKANRIQSVGVTLADKRAGPFRLEIAWIKGEKAADGPLSTKKADDTTDLKDIVDTAEAAGQFKTLLAAVKAAGLVEALKGKGPLTVFAPNDDAFAKLAEGTVAELLKPENRDKLTAILTYHVVPGRILLGAQSPVTLEGRALSIRTSGDFEVNGVKVIATDIAASNGVIHIIDTVLIPPADKRTPSDSAQAVIEIAINRGVPLFNAGQAAACAAIYEVTIESLLKSHTDALTKQNRSTLEAALKKMRAEKDPNQKAWILRLALDVVYESLSGD